MRGPPSTTSPRSRARNAMTIDVEDYFQVSAFESHVPRHTWSSRACRVERNVERILEILGERGVSATFFTLGWVAERYPALVRRLVDLGHELASHGYQHVRVTQQDRRGFGEDIRRTKRLLEDTAGVEVLGYRAASYSIDRSNLWAHEELRDAGYAYSSSIYPIRHDLYGIPDAPRFGYAPLADDSGFIEIPVTTLEVLGQRLPCGGGGYFRLYPYWLSRWAIAQVNRVERQSAIFYFHPWELDPDQPRLSGLSRKTRFRHYVNLGRTERRLARLLADFQWDRMDRVFLPPGARRSGQPGEPNALLPIDRMRAGESLAQGVAAR